MKKIIVVLLILLFLGLLGGYAQDNEAADLIVKNGKIFTVSEKRPEAQALAVRDGTIIALGKNKDIEKYIGPSTRVIDVRKKLVLPGFIDAHCHFSLGGKSLTKLDMRDARSPEDIQKRIAEKIKGLPEGAPVFGYASYPDISLFPNLGWPTKEILDEVSPENPVVIQRRGGHALWVNSVALVKSNITKETKAPSGGEIVRDPKTGEPTGILKEAACGLLKVRDIPKPKDDIERALKHAAKLGITSIQTGSYLKEVEIFNELKEEGKLTLRVYAWLPVGGLDEYIKKGIKTGQGDEMVKIGLLKMYIDGTIGVRSALMFEPFAEEPGNTGLAQYEEEKFYEIFEKAHQHGYQVGVHAIGDKGVHWVLNAVERAQQQHERKGLRHRVEHNTVNILPDTRRFGKLGVVASMQPNITGNELYRRVRLGEERARRVDMWRTLLNNGAVLAWGTDWPVSSINPMENIYQVVTRYYPEQRLTMAEAIKYYTYGPAYASHEEEIKGSLDVGKLADMVVLSKNLFTIKPQDILKTEILYTIVGGKIVYEKPPAN